ncbi:hypothetical protein LDENG_00240360 [Lucifuga dentata]|nr:hypothetical protein LDENG_00240360 [Lucifuga dentata]
MFLWVLCDFLNELEKFCSLGLLGRFMAVPCFLCVGNNNSLCGLLESQSLRNEFEPFRLIDFSFFWSFFGLGIVWSLLRTFSCFTLLQSFYLMKFRFNRLQE